MKKKSVVDVNALISQALIPYISAQLGPFLSARPEWQLIFYLAIGLYGIYLYFRQDELNEVIELIEKNPEKFRAELVKSDEFKKGFLIWMEYYLKQRTRQKREVLKKILLGFSISEEKEKYRIEQYLDCLNRISPTAIEFLVFMNREIVPLVEEAIRIDYSQYNDLQDSEKERVLKSTRDSHFFWTYIANWIYENYDPNSEKVKQKYGIDIKWPTKKINEVYNVQAEISSQIHLNIEEIVSLGLFQVVGDGGGTSYTITTFGRDFLQFMANLESTETSEVHKKVL